MNLKLNVSLANGYKSNSQIVRLLTENWVLNNSYCPSCGISPLNEFENNRPVADFYCKKCSEQFELKSKSGKLSNTITDGAYSTMIERINSENNPNFFFLTYTKQWTVNDFLIIPKQFFTPEIIIKRPPLAETARRAGWIGCNIDISKVADAGKVFLIKNSKTMNCVDLIKKEQFTLDELYKFEQKLKSKYPKNNFIKDKIRQQLQILRDKGIIEFVGRGNYKKIKYGKF